MFNSSKNGFYKEGHPIVILNKRKKRTNSLGNWVFLKKITLDSNFLLPIAVKFSRAAQDFTELKRFANLLIPSEGGVEWEGQS